MNFNEERIAVAIVVQSFDLLNVAAGLALLPKRFATAAVKMRVTRLNRFLKRFFVHVGEHKDLPTFLLHNRRN